MMKMIDYVEDIPDFEIVASHCEADTAQEEENMKQLDLIDDFLQTLECF